MLTASAGAPARYGPGGASLVPADRVRAALLRSAQHQLGYLGASEESKRDERRTRARGDVHHSCRRLVDARDETRPGMRERDPASREREADLAGVEMPREDQVE